MYSTEIENDNTEQLQFQFILNCQGPLKSRVRSTGAFTSECSDSQVLVFNMQCTKPGTDRSTFNGLT